MSLGQFTSTEFEKPCVKLLKMLYGDDNIEYRGGSAEKGADVICTHTDPLGLNHRVAVQIKMWQGEADWERPLHQIRQAYQNYDNVTGGIVMVTTETISERFRKEAQNLEEELGIPIRILCRDDIVRLFLKHLPSLIEPGKE